MVRPLRQTGLADAIMIVDDGTTGGTLEMHSDLNLNAGIKSCSFPRLVCKGVAMRVDIKAASGVLIIIQDTDLEYNPSEYSNLLQSIDEDIADEMHGYCFLSADRDLIFLWNNFASILPTFMTNIMNDSNCTNMETGYRVFIRAVVQDMALDSQCFDSDWEVMSLV